MSIVSALLNSGKTRSFEQAFGCADVTTQAMRYAILDWAALYYDDTQTPDEDPCQRIPVTIVNKLVKTTFSEYTATPSTGAAPFAGAVLDGLDAVRGTAVQQAMIGGVSWLKPLLHPDGTVHFAVISRSNVMVLERDDMDRVCSLGMAERTVRGRDIYTLLERRTVDPGGYLTMENRLFASRDEKMLGHEVPLSELAKYQRLASVYTFQTPVWSLGLIPVRMPMANCVDGSPDPVSVYAPAAGLIHNINRNEAQLNGEFGRGKSRLIVSADMMTTASDGTRRFEDDLFVGLDDDQSSTGVTIFSPALRETSFLARKAEYLRNVETLIGLKRGLLSEVEAAERTAKEITSSEGDYNLTIIDFQQMWTNAVREAVRVCGILGRLYQVYTGPGLDPDKDVVITWGNGVLYDEDKTNQELLDQVERGLLAPERYLGWYYDLPHDTPDERAKIRRDYMPELRALSDEGDI